MCLLCVHYYYNSPAGMHTTSVYYMYYLCVYVCVHARLARSRAHLNGEHSSCNCNWHLLHLIGIIGIVFEFLLKTGTTVHYYSAR